MAENATLPSRRSNETLRGLAFVFLAISALISVVIWILGVGVPGHAIFGLFFVALHVGVAVFIVASPPKYSGLRLIAAMLIVPTEIAVIVLIAYAGETIKYGFKEPEVVCKQKCEESGYQRYQYAAPGSGAKPTGCSCFN